MKHLSQTDLIIIRGYLSIAKLALIKDINPKSAAYSMTTELIDELKNKIDMEISEMMDKRRKPE